MSGAAPAAPAPHVPAAVERFAEAAARADREAARAVVDEQLAAGADAVDVICDVLAPAQALVGTRWQEGRWSTALEHRVSAITLALLGSLPQPRLPLGGPAPVPVICCEGEWHTLPAVMATAVLRLRGIDAEVIVPSLPADEIAGFLGPAPPPVVAVACSLPTHLVGAWRTVRALRAAGVTVVAGGRGFGTGERWASAIGAHHVARDFRHGAELVGELLARPRAPRAEDVVHWAVASEVDALRVDAPTWAEAVTTAARLRWMDVERRPAAILATRADVGAALDAVGAAALVDDEALVRGFVGWLESATAARGLPLSFVSVIFSLVGATIPDRHPRLRAMAAAGLAAATQPLI